MTGVLRLTACCALALGALAVGAGAASAQTFYVNGRSGSDTNTCRGKLPSEVCATIKKAIERAEGVAGPNTIEVSEEKYEESIVLNSAADKGLTIVGEEPGVIIVSKTNATVTVGAAAGAVTLTNLDVNLEPSSTHAAIVASGALTLDNVAVENGSSGGKNGIQVEKPGSLTMNGGSVVMENGSTGYGVSATEAPAALSGVTVTDGGGAEPEAGGVSSFRSGLSIASSKVNVLGGLTEEADGIKAREDGSVSLQNVTVTQDGPSVGVELSSSPTTANGLTVLMEDAASKTVGVFTGALGAPSSTFEHVEVSGRWQGRAFEGQGGTVTVSDSRIFASAAHTAAAVTYIGAGESAGLLVRRSLVQSASDASRGALQAALGNVTIDSSEILGGVNGVFFENTLAGTHTLTIAASTVDAGAVGVAGDAFGVKGIEANAKGGPSSVTDVAVEGSIVLEEQAANETAGNQTSVTCAYTAAPNQAQAAKGTEGSIACASGTSGNTNVTGELPSLFAEPFTTYALSSASSAVDSVPAGAISLPFGLTPSATDLLGNPRIVDGNGDCVAVQDKGALELQGHAAACPPAPAPPAAGAATPAAAKPVAGVISALAISPSSFAAAPSGATVSKASRKRKSYGAKVTWRDTQAATTTLTVLAPTPGRMQGRKCRKPGRSNRHGRRCTLYNALGTFTHGDRAGADSLHFSGRLRGHKLAKGSYRLQAVAHNAAGNGPATSQGFQIK